MFQPLPPMERAADTMIGATLPKALIVLSTIGKNAMVAPSAILDAGPRPKNRT